VLAKENAFTPSPASALALRGLAEREGGGSSVIAASALGKGTALCKPRPMVCVDGDGAEEMEECMGESNLVV